MWHTLTESPTREARPILIGKISFEIDHILSTLGGIVKRFAKIGSASVSAVCVVRVIRRKNKRKKSGSNWHEALVANYKERRTVYRQTLFEINICGNCRIVNKRKPRPLSADAG